MDLKESLLNALKDFMEDCYFDTIIDTVQETIPALLEVIIGFIFVLLAYQEYGKRKDLYFLALLMFLVFDYVTFGFSISYIDALDHGLSVSEEYL